VGRKREKILRRINSQKSDWSLCMQVVGTHCTVLYLLGEGEAFAVNRVCLHTYMYCTQLMYCTSTAHRCSRHPGLHPINSFLPSPTTQPRYKFAFQLAFLHPEQVDLILWAPRRPQVRHPTTRPAAEATLPNEIPPLSPFSSPADPAKDVLYLQHITGEDQNWLANEIRVQRDARKA
jgi:hypothetical protein